MLFLNPDSAKIKTAKKEYYNGISLFIIERILRLENKLNVEDWALFEKFFVNFIEPNLKDILVGEPQKLVKINQVIAPFLKFPNIFLDAVIEIFKYDLFIKKASTRYDAYQLAKALDVRTCTYCNRNYTSTVFKKNGEGLIRPQFDHYFDKANYPLLALSFYNLIPSCSTCNSTLKGKKKFRLDNYLHPYVDNKVENIRFTYFFTGPSSIKVKIKVITPDSSKEKKTVETFAIEEVYNSHVGILNDILKTKQYFSKRYLEVLKLNLLREVVVSDDEMYRIVFGTEYSSDKFINRPFSKFKKDILTELGVV